MSQRAIARAPGGARDAAAAVPAAAPASRERRARLAGVTPDPPTHASARRESPDVDAAAPAPVPTATVLGYDVAVLDLAAAIERAGALVDRSQSDGRDRQIVTLNPEFVVLAERDERLRAALRRADLRVADGVGIVWAARRGGTSLPGRVPGVELATGLLRARGSSLRAYFYGGEPGVAAAAAEAARARFGISIAGHRHGFQRDAREVEDVVADIRASDAHLLLAGLGPRQETFLAEHRGAFGGLLGIGVGGTLDVLAGRATRTPAWTRRLGLEWAWRVGLDPSRWHRVPRLARFAWRVVAEGRSEERPRG